MYRSIINNQGSIYYTQHRIPQSHYFDDIFKVSLRGTDRTIPLALPYEYTVCLCAGERPLEYALTTLWGSARIFIFQTNLCPIRITDGLPGILETI